MTAHSPGVTSRVPAAAHVLAILKFLAGQRGPVAASAIAAGLGIPRSSCYQLLAELIDQGYVIHLPGERRYGLGVAAFELGTSYTRQEPLARLGAGIIAELATATGESAHLAVMHGNEVIYLCEERAPRKAHLVTGVGVRLPAHLTATGRAMLAALPREQLWALYPDGEPLVMRTDRGPANYRALRQSLDRVRAQGYAFEEGEVSPGIDSVGIAVLDHVGWPAAAIAVSFENVPAEMAEARSHHVDRVRRASAELGRRIRGVTSER